ncbi:MAG: hypothetical protein OHK0038_17210 [Flammeovirgaceae bacterium]
MRLLLLFIGFSLVYSLHAQPFNNEWIDPSLKYYKIKVNEEGIYRVTQEDLKAVGFPVDLINPKNLKLYFRGIEQSIHVEGEEDGFFDKGDYIEFYGRKNDGFVDAQMYAEDGGFQTTPYFNMYSDATYYFLTSSIDGSRGKRMVRSNVNSGEVINTHLEKQQKSLHITYSNKSIEINYGRYFQCYPYIGCGPVNTRWTSAKGPVSKNISSNTNQNTDVIPLKVENINRNGVFNIELRVIGTFVGTERVDESSIRNVEFFAGSNKNIQRSIGKIEVKSFEGVIFKSVLEANDFGLNDSIYITYKVSSTRNNAAVSVTSLELSYTQNIKFNNELIKKYNLSAGNNASITLENLNGNIWAYDITQENSPIILKTQNNQIFIGENQSNRKLLWVRELKKPISITSSGIFPFKLDEDYVIITHPRLMQPATGYSNPCQAYADYRASVEGGSHKVLLLNIFDVYDMFSFGEENPFAIRLLAKYLKKKGKIEHLFLIGKGLSVNLQYERAQPQSSNWGFYDLVPTYGFPSSDNGFITGLIDPKTNNVDLSIGRLSCQTPQEVANYLNKVKEFEADTHEHLWKKELIHVSGGATYEEFTRFKSYISSFRNKAIKDYLGANVKLGFKNTSNEVGELDLANEINQGKMMVTFYGHGSAFLTDINIGYVSDPKQRYANKGKYPMIFFNSCDVGDIYNLIETVGEDWMTEPNKGSIAILAQSHIGFESTLVGYVNTMYESYFNKKENINLPIGKVMQNFLNEYLNSSPDNLYNISNLQQYTLQADPAIVLFKPNKPDYGFINNQITISNPLKNVPLTSESDSFQIQIPIANYGLTSHQTFKISIKRYFSDGTSKTYPLITSNAISFSDTLNIILTNDPEDKEKGFGTNTFEVMLDASLEVDEYSEKNNKVQVDIVIPKGTMQIIYPSEFSINSQRKVAIYAQTPNPFAQQREYLFQLDTSYAFNSPVFKDTVVIGSTIPFWETYLRKLDDTTTYFIRVKPIQLSENEIDLWGESSFTIIDNKTGWGQRKVPQISKNRLLKIEHLNKQWNFTDIGAKIKAYTSGALFPIPNYNVNFNNIDYLVAGGCVNNALGLITIDKNNGKIYAMPNIRGEGFYYLYCGIGIPGSVIYLKNQDISIYHPLNNLFNYALRNDGDYYLIFNIGNVNVKNLRDIDYEGFNLLGISKEKLQKINPGDPFIFFGRKNTPDFKPVEILADYNPNSPTLPSQQTIEGEFQISVKFTDGSITTPLIGPAESWDEIVYQVTGKDSENDKFSIQVIPIKIDGSKGETILVTSNKFKINHINAEEFPYLQMIYQVEDTLKKTPMQLDSWAVYYQPAPEGVLLFDKPTSEINGIAEYEEGDIFKANLIFKNISETSFKKEITAYFTYQHVASGRKETIEKKFPPLAKGESISTAVEYETITRTDINRFTASFNPKILPELNYNNNTLQLAYQVNKDKRNPVLDVTFDGRRIMDGDIVSPMPQILVNVKDENKFLILNDTSHVSLLLQKCESCPSVRIPFANNMQWSNLSGNNFQISYKPSVPLPNGKYKLEVIASDVSGNSSGDTPYSVHFEVINESQISHFLPYPNPFSDNVRFVFTITGNEIPEDLKIQIMTVSGKIIREITQDELGSIHIGNNISQYAWDGKDEFGEQLANGVYLYRVMIKSQNSFKQFSTSVDQYFEHGIGKMYLLK